jgi:nucleotide-binding universal stress UspA family protein
MTQIIVGVDDSEQARDAVAFARELHEASRASVLLACAWPVDEVPAPDLGPALDRLAGEFRGEVATRIVPSTSPARSLHELAEAEQALLLVVGSSHRSRLNQVLAGSTAMRLIHGAPCAVAVVPRAYHVVGLEPRFDWIGCAVDGSGEAAAALDVAVAAARSRGARVRVIRAFDPADYATTAVAYAPAYLDARDELERRAREDVDAIVAELPDDVGAEGVVGAGAAPVVLAGESGRLDLLFTGSRGYGPRHAVLAGSVTRRLLQIAQCPVVVLPRAAEQHLERMFAVRASQPASP